MPIRSRQNWLKPHLGGMRCDLTDEKDAALARLLSDTINDDRYLLLARIRAFEEDPRQDPAGAVTCTAAAPIRHREIHRAYKSVSHG